MSVMKRVLALTLVLVYVIFSFCLGGENNRSHSNILHLKNNKIAFLEEGLITQTIFNYTGSSIQWTVPPNTNSLTIEAWGAEGGTNANSDGYIGGLGGYIKATIYVTEGVLCYIYVGGRGSNSRSRGFNGGGYGGLSSGGGGGATDFRCSTDSLESRLVVAAGGGGNKNNCGSGGAGGGLSGESGFGAGGCGNGGGGGTQSEGGVSSGDSAQVGKFGIGGNGHAGPSGGGGGGGGYYGGGGGLVAGGGGGSSYAHSDSVDVTHTSGARSGNGQLIITYYDAPTSQPSLQPTSNPSSPSSQPTSDPSSRPSQQPSGQPSRQPSTQPSVEPSLSPSSQPTTKPSGQPSIKPSSQPSSRPTLLPTAQPTLCPTSQPTEKPSSAPTAGPSNQPSGNPSVQPSCQPSAAPSIRPSSQPSTQPSSEPTRVPTGQPSEEPSSQPSEEPSGQPSLVPTAAPSSGPSDAPSSQPTGQPTDSPSAQPSDCPSTQPVSAPSAQPTERPSMQPTVGPTMQPLSVPSVQPSTQPSSRPSSQPTSKPSHGPSSGPSAQPSARPSCRPSGQPSSQPTCNPTVTPTSRPSHGPSSGPSAQPTTRPSCRPSGQPSSQPIGIPTVTPTSQPSVAPSCQPVCAPTGQPSNQPSAEPSGQPYAYPSSCPTSQPSMMPSSGPSVQPSAVPSSQPTVAPSAQPSRQPSVPPTLRPSSQPSSQPSCPTFQPTFINNGQLPSSVPLSVVYMGTDNNRNVTDLRVVLPFQFVSYVHGDQFFDVSVKQPVFGSSYYLVGSAVRGIQVDIAVSDLVSITPSVSYDLTGRSVSVAGDINGDGCDDLVIGVPYAAKVYVLFGNRNGFVNMTEGFTVFGAKSSDLTGWSVSGAGDVNNDTFADIVIGAPHAVNAAGKRQSGAVYVLYGMHNGFSNVLLGEPLSPTAGFVTEGQTSQEFLALSVGGAGDVNGDGYDDIIVGALRASNIYAGAATVVFGGPFDLPVGRTTLTITGEVWSWFGYSVSSAGGMNGDRLSDLVIGSLGRKTGVLQPSAYVLYGNTTFGSASSVTLSAEYGLRVAGGGVFVSGLGDVNGDQLSDVLVSGPDYSLDSGGGLVVILPTKLPPVSTTAPSWQPSEGPTVRPSSQKPSLLPSTSPSLGPTQPTVVPSQAPSSPTFAPTVAPTQPTSVPTLSPSCPSGAPSCQPSATPSAQPTARPCSEPSGRPSSQPSTRPTMARTAKPTVVAPSRAPTRAPTLLPSRRPVFRPTAVPTAMSGRNITYQLVEVVTTETAIYYRDWNNIHYIVKATADVTIVAAPENGGIGAAKFTVYPNPHTTLTIRDFSLSTDLIDLSAFNNINGWDDLSITTTLAATNSSSPSVLQTIHQGSNQKIVLRYNSTTANQGLNQDQFIFAQSVSGTTEEDTQQSNSSRLPVVGIVVGSIIIAALAYSAYKCVWLQRDELIRRQIKAEPLSWEEMEKGNRTFVRFVHRDTPDQSLGSSDSSSGSDSGSGDDDNDGDSNIPSPVLSSASSAEHKSSVEGESVAETAEDRRMFQHESGCEDSYHGLSSSDDYSQLSFGAYVGSGSDDCCQPDKECEDDNSCEQLISAARQIGRFCQQQQNDDAGSGRGGEFTTYYGDGYSSDQYIGAEEGYGNDHWPE